MSLLEELIKLRDEGPDFPGLGICGNVKVLHVNHLSGLFAAWPEFSGNILYPVPPSCTKFLNSEQAFDLGEADEMWNLDHPYGAARLRLLDFCIETLQAQAE
jgi:hypothetical protein